LLLLLLQMIQLLYLLQAFVLCFVSN
jgi:hypothetical protein